MAPLKHVIDDTSQDSWMESILAHPVLGNEYMLMHQLHRVLPGYAHVPEANRFGRAYQDIYGASDSSAVVLRRNFRRQAARLKEDDPKIVKIYAGPRAQKLKSESRIRMTSDPVRLLSAAFDTKGDDVLSRGRRVEAIPRYTISRLLLEGDEKESEADVDEQCAEIFDWVIERVFHRSTSDPIDIYPLIDPVNQRLTSRVEYRIDGDPAPVEVPQGLERRHYDTTCRYFMSPTRGLRPAVFDDDVKGDLASVLKRIRKASLLSDEMDKRRFTISVMTEEDLGEMEAIFRKAMSRPPFSIKEVENRYADGASKSNGASSTLFAVIRFILIYTDPKTGQEIAFEGCLQLEKDRANTLFSDTDARHDWYRLKQLCEGYFRFRYPRFLFRVDFREESEDYKELVAALR